MYPLALLHRLSTAKFPLHLDGIDDIQDVIELKRLGWIRAAIPSPSKGRDTYGQQDPAVVRAITPAGRAALAKAAQ